MVHFSEQSVLFGGLLGSEAGQAPACALLCNTLRLMGLSKFTTGLVPPLIGSLTGHPLYRPSIGFHVNLGRVSPMSLQGSLFQNYQSQYRDCVYIIKQYLN